MPIVLISQQKSKGEDVWQIANLTCCIISAHPNLQGNDVNELTKWQWSRWLKGTFRA